MKKLLICFLFIFLNACGESEKVFTPLADDAVILAFGDSLTYGKGANKESSYPAVLEKLSQHKVINAGISGEISASGLNRLPALLDKHQPQLLILIHGGNDILRNIARETTADNLKQMIVLAKQRDIKVVMVGVPSFGLLSLKSAKIYQQVANEEGVPINIEILPSILISASLKADRVHPNAAGYQKMAEAVYELLLKSGAL